MKRKIGNWGNYPMIETEVIETENIDRIKQFISEKEEVIARGNGRCYGDASLNDNIISTLRLNKFIDFDEQTGVLECEAGILLSDILELIIPRGYFLPVTPGTKFITVGGAIASDVHGKNHHKEGCFSNFVTSFRLLNENNEILTCSPTENSDLYWATIGGMGLTGIILSANIQLKPIETAYIKHEALKCENLDEVFKAMDESADWTYTVAWIDCLQKGKDLGRSILFRGEHAKVNDIPENKRKKPLDIKSKKPFNIPVFFPNFALNTWSVKIFNFLYYHKQTAKHLKNIIDYNTFFYPLDILDNWNKIYGKQGFIQYQFVLPPTHAKEGLKEVLSTIANSGEGSFLAVLKLFGANNPKAYNSFPKEGWTLALDFKVNKSLPNLIKKLDDIIEKNGGRIYRTKDSMSKPELTDYLKNLNSKKFNSMQHKRINQ